MTKDIPEFPAREELDEIIEEIALIDTYGIDPHRPTSEYVDTAHPHIAHNTFVDSQSTQKIDNEGEIDFHIDLDPCVFVAEPVFDTFFTAKSHRDADTYTGAFTEESESVKNSEALPMTTSTSSDTSDKLTEDTAVASAAASSSFPKRASVRSKRQTIPLEEPTTSDNTMTRSVVGIKREKRVRKLPWYSKLLRMWPVLIVVVALVISAGVIASMYFMRPDASQASKVSPRIEVEGRHGAFPVVKLQGQIPYTFAKSRTLIEGEGKTLEEGSDAVLQITVFDGKTGRIKGSKKRPQLLVGKVNAAAMDKELIDAIKGQKEGSRQLIRRPIVEKNHQVMEIAVVDILPTVAQGEEKSLPEDFPVSIDNNKDQPEVTSHSEDPPSVPSLATVIEGPGAQIGKDATVIAQYGAWSWTTDEKTGYTWSGEGPTLIDIDKTYVGLKDTLPDQKVGSRLVLVIPAEQAKGDHAVIVIMDILGILDTK
ncbi:MAG: hypothetical protein Q4P66_05725 [Actinomycetaceae bacterium]|nr:hypothetical protein [Actinomycetaceae bacterium]